MNIRLTAMSRPRQIIIRQLYEEREVGRITFVLLPRR